MAKITTLEIETKEGCTDAPEWIIYDKQPDVLIYSCTSHLSEMVSRDTKYIEPYWPGGIHRKQKTCCYLYSTEEVKEINLGV